MAPSTTAKANVIRREKKDEPLDFSSFSLTSASLYDPRRPSFFTSLFDSCLSIFSILPLSSRRCIIALVFSRTPSPPLCRLRLASVRAPSDTSRTSSHSRTSYYRIQFDWGKRLPDIFLRRKLLALHCHGPRAQVEQPRG